VVSAADPRQNTHDITALSKRMYVIVLELESLISWSATEPDTLLQRPLNRLLYQLRLMSVEQSLKCLAKETEVL
jgi:hypothetical protein